MIKTENNFCEFKIMPESIMARKNNVINLTYSFINYFNAAASGTCFEDIRFDGDIKYLKLWNGKSKKKIIIIIDSIISAVLEKDGSVADVFTCFDKSQSVNCINAEKWGFIKELPTEKALKVANGLIKNDKKFATAEQYVALFKNIKNYYKIKIH